jgi:hypothetical protein
LRPAVGQAALLGFFETVHRESSTRVVRAVVLEQTNVTIADHFTEISVEFAAKEAAAKRLMAAEQCTARELEEKAVCDAGYPAWQAYWPRRREHTEAARAAKWAVVASARKETTSQPSQPWVFIDLGDDAPSTCGGVGH